MKARSPLPHSIYIIHLKYLWVSYPTIDKMLIGSYP